MRIIATILLVGVFGLLGCDGNGNGDGGDTGGENGSKTAATTDGGSSGTEASSGANGSSSDGSTKPATKPVAKPGGGPVSGSESLDSTTAEGTMGLFLSHMQRGDFASALDLVDPESIGYTELAQAVTVLADLVEKAKENPDASQLIPVMRAFFSRGWEGVVWQPVSIQSERARFEVKVVDSEARTVDLQKMDDQWYVLAPEWVMRVKADVSDLMPDEEGSAGDGEAG